MSANHPLDHRAPRRMRITGTFFPAGAGAPTYASGDDHLDWSVVRTSAGLFTITIKKVRHCRLMAKFYSLQLAAIDDKHLQWGAYTAPTATTDATIAIRVCDISGAAETDIAADANNSISFELEFSDTKARNT